MKSTTVFIFFLAIMACTTQGQNVSELAFRDQIWGKTYNAIAGKIQPAARGNISISGLVSDSLGLTAQDAGNLIIFATRYTADAFSIEKVVFRYPHYNPDSIQHDLDRLENLQFIKGGVNDEYALTNTGRKAVDYYWHLKREQAKTFDLLSESEVDDLYRVLRKIVDAALILEDGFKNQSIHHHQQSLPSNFESYPKILRVIDLLWQYIAFTNDTSHYKYDNFIHQSNDAELKKFLTLLPLSKELMSATSSGRTYDLNRCYNQPNWRMGKEGCDLAVDELIEHGLVEKSAHSIKHTDYGAVLSQEVEDFADRRRYATWSDLSQNEYATFKKLVLSLSED